MKVKVKQAIKIDLLSIGIGFILGVMFAGLIAGVILK